MAEGVSAARLDEIEAAVLSRFGVTFEECFWLIAEVRRLEGDLRSEKATNAELRRQLAGTGALLGKAEGEWRDRALTAETRVQAVLDLLDPAAGMAAKPFTTDERYFEERDIRAALGEEQ